MRLKIVRLFEVPRTKSFFGSLYWKGDPIAMTVEREWQSNLPNISCVPAGWYSLEPHNGTKYKNTFALRGETVSHHPEAGVARSACVLHGSRTGKGLEGCIAFGDRINIDGSEQMELRGSKSLQRILALLRADSGPHSLEIVELKP